MKLEKLAGATSEIWQVFIRDSSSTTGGGLTGLVFNTASLTAYYHRDTDTTATAIALVTMAVGTFTSSGFKEIDATNMPGWYQFCPPNAAIAAGAKSCAFHLKGATNMAPLPIEVQLTAVNPDDAVRGGMTALPNANAEAAGGLYTRGSGAGQINQDANGRVDTNTKAWAGTAVTLTSSLPDVNTKTIAAGIIAAATFAANALDAVWSTAVRVLTAGTNLNDLSAAQVKTQVVAALNTDTYAEPVQGAPVATTTLVDKIGHLYKAYRNKKTQTSATFSLFADDAVTVDQKAAVSDDGTTFTSGEIGSGP